MLRVFKVTVPTEPKHRFGELVHAALGTLEQAYQKLLRNRMELTIARIGKAHGLRGEVALDLRTDIPEERFFKGASIDTKPAERGPLTVARTRVASGRWYVHFEQSVDRTFAESLNGVELVVQAEESDEEDAWYGKYHPTENPSFIEIDSERAQYWLSVGAQPTEQVLNLLKITGDWQKFKGLPGQEGTLRVKAAKADAAELVATAAADAEKAKAKASEAKAEAATEEAPAEEASEEA
jgi:small subunit ribosomal protein S16